MPLHIGVRELPDGKTVESDRTEFKRATMEAIEETEAMIRDPSLGKTYTDVDEMMGELLS